MITNMKHISVFFKDYFKRELELTNKYIDIQIKKGEGYSELEKYRRALVAELNK